MMTTTTIANYLNAIQPVIDVGVLWDPKLLTCLTSDGCIPASYDSISEYRLLLASDSLNILIQLVWF